MTMRMYVIAGAMLILAASTVPLVPTEAMNIPGEEELYLAAAKKFREGDESQALRQIRLFLKHYSKSSREPQARYMAAECFFKKGNYQQALSEYEKVLESCHDDDFLTVSTILRLGESSFNLGDYPRSLEYFNRLIDDFSESFLLPEAIYSQGQGFLALGKWGDMQRSIERLLQVVPEYATREDVAFAQGVLQFHRGDYIAAMGFFQQVSNDMGIFYTGLCLQKLGQYMKSVQMHRQLVDRYPQSPFVDDAAYAIGDAFFQAEQYSLATASFQRVIQDFPHSPFTPYAHYRQACVLYRAESYRETVELLKPLPEIYPDSPAIPFVQYLIGNSLRGMGKIDEAIFAYTKVGSGSSQVAAAALHKIILCYGEKEDYSQLSLMADKFLRRFPGDPLAGRVTCLLGVAETALGRHDRALQAFQTVMDKFPGTELAEQSLYLSTVTYYQREQYQELITNYHFVADNLKPTSNPWRALTYFYLGEAYYQLEMYDKAQGMYTLVVTGYPESEVAVFAVQGITACYSQQGEYDRALSEQERLLDQIARQEALRPSDQLTIADIYFNQKEYENALTIFEGFIQENPRSPETPQALFQAGKCYYWLRYYQQAIETWNRLIAQFPDVPLVPKALAEVAETQFGLQDYGAALTTYQRIATEGSDPETAKNATFQVGNCYYNLKLNEEAIAAYQHFIDTYPEDSRSEDALIGIQMCYYRAGRSLSELIQKYPNSTLAADAHWQMAQEAYAKEDYARAEQYFEKVILNFPTSKSAPASLFYIGECNYRLENLQKATASYRNFLATYPENGLIPQAKFRLANILYKMNRFDESLNVYGDLASSIGDTVYAPASLYNVALCLKQMQRWVELIEAYQLYLKRYPSSQKAAWIQFQIGLVYQTKLKDYGKAIVAYSHVSPTEELSTTELQFRIAECHDLMNQGKDAMELFERLVDARPADDPYRLAALARLGQKYEDQARWSEAVDIYEVIIDSGGKEDWIEAARERISIIKKF